MRDHSLRLLVAGDVDGAIEQLEKASPAARRLTLTKSVIGNPNPNQPRIARAPTQAQQVAFFTRARALTALRGTDELKYRVALAYQAVEANDDEVLRDCIAFFDRQRLPLKHARAYTDFALLGGKRGHHLYYSAALAELHTALSVGDCDHFEAVINDACEFFEKATVKVRDKGFGWALPNAIRIAGLGFLHYRLQGKVEKAEATYRLMPLMLRLAVSRRVGPMEYPQVNRAFRILHEMERVRQDADENDMPLALSNLLRLRSEAAQNRLRDNHLGWVGVNRAVEEAG